MPRKSLKGGKKDQKTPRITQLEMREGGKMTRTGIQINFIIILPKPLHVFQSITVSGFESCVRLQGFHNVNIPLLQHIPWNFLEKPVFAFIFIEVPRKSRDRRGFGTFAGFLLEEVKAFDDIQDR